MTPADALLLLIFVAVVFGAGGYLLGHAEGRAQSAEHFRAEAADLRRRLFTGG